MKEGYQPKSEHTPTPPSHEAGSCSMPKYERLKSIRTAPVPRFLTFIRNGYALLVPLEGIAYIRIDDNCDGDGKSVYLYLSNGSCLSFTKEEYIKACESFDV